MQRFWAHREKEFSPDYPKKQLTEESDYDTFFQQTGLGKAAIDKLLSENDFQSILNAQEKFFDSGEVSCEPLLGWFTREDRLCIPENSMENEELPELVDLQPGDIILTLSTHSAGWRHGHAALVLDESTTIESMVWGTNTAYGQIENWRSYSNFAVLRVKNITPELQQQVTEYARNSLYDVPYHLSAGFIGTKAPEPEDPRFGVQCSYLVWYAWNHFGYDLDSDGGCLVTANDILHSDLLEVVQIYGMDPKNYGVFKEALPDVRWHDLRGTCATILLMNGMSPKAIAKNLGHASENVTLANYIDTAKISVIKLDKLDASIASVVSNGIVDEKSNDFSNVMPDISEYIINQKQERMF